MIIGIDKFAGIAPRIAEHLLPDAAASDAVNIKLQSGSIMPFGGSETVSGVSVDPMAKTIYKHPITGVWWDFVYDTDIVRSPLADDAYDRLYFTDDNPAIAPKMAANDAFSVLYDLGIPAPASAPSLTVNGAAGDDPLLAETRAYVTTYVSEYGEEGPPSTPSSLATVYPDEGNTVTVSLPLAPAGNHNITSVRIYRTNMGSTGTEYQLVATVAIGTSSYVDAIDSLELGIVLPSTGWDKPPTDLRGLCKHPAGFLIGFTESEVCLSERWLPHAWPVANRYPIGDKVVGVAVFGTSILVLTNRFPVLLSGADPALMSEEKLEIGGACLSKRGIVDLGYSVVYPSDEGLILVGVGNTPTVVTSSIIDKETWKGYGPSTMIADRVGSKYFCVCPDGPIEGFIFDPATVDFVPITTDARALFYDPESGYLYMRDDEATTIKSFDENQNSLVPYYWKSKNFRLPFRASLGAGHVFADAYPVVMKIYADGALKMTKTVTSNEPFKLPSGFTATHYQMEVEGTQTINTVMLATSYAELGAA